MHDDVHDDVCEELVRFARKQPVGAGTDENVLIGPLQNDRQLNVIADLVADARNKGRVLLGGDAPKRNGKKTGYFFPLTIVADLQNGDRLVDEEQFGPALPVIRFRDVDEAVEKANDNPNGLGGSVWSRDINAARQVAIRLECGSVWINKHGMIQPNAPFGGVKQSGLGVEFGEEGLAEYTDLQVLFS